MAVVAWVLLAMLLADQTRFLHVLLLDVWRGLLPHLAQQRADLGIVHVGMILADLLPKVLGEE